MSNDALIRDLSAGLVPVRRRSLSREAGLLVGLVATELALILGLGLMRPDMSEMIGSAYMLWKLGSLAALAVLGCAIAVNSFSPTASPRGGLAFAAVLAAAAMIGGLAIGLMPASGGTFLERLSPAHGLLCAASIVVLSLPIMAMLAGLMRCAAPVHPKASSLASGLAAGACGALIFAFCCPVNDPLYIVVWYFAGCAAVMAAARWLLPRRYRL